jgi:hypothetical protein
MNETDRLRDLLEQAAPHSPDLTAPERSAAVVRRGRAARTRDRVLVGGAAAAVLAVAVLVPVLRGGDHDQRVTPAPAPPATVAEPCPAAPVDVTTLGAVRALDDVVAVRSCPTTGKQVDDPLPNAPLTDAEAAAFAEDVAAMPDYAIPPMCAISFIISSPWALQVQTASGEIAMIGGPQRLCSSVRVGGTDVAADQVVAAFVGNLTGVSTSLACPRGDQPPEAPTWNASFDPSTAVAGVFCTNPADWRDPGAGWTGHDLTPDELAAVRDQLATNLTPTPRDDMCIDPADEQLLVLADADGDQAAYLDRGCAGQFSSARGYWTPVSAARAALTGSRG